MQPYLHLCDDLCHGILSELYFHNYLNNGYFNSSTLSKSFVISKFCNLEVCWSVSLFVCHFVFILQQRTYHSGEPAVIL